MSRPSIITAEILAPMLQQGRTAQEIAAALCVQSPAVTRACHRLGLSTPGKGRPRKKPDPEAAERKPAILPDTREATLVATGGRYGDLRARAARWGVTETKARQEWHKLRLPVGRGACL